MKLRGFTIVELLIVIVVIAIIAAITILAYSGTTSKATVASIQADLTNAKKQLLAFQASSTTNSFPTAINCNNPSSTEICLKSTGSNTYTYNVNNSNSPPTFNLTSTNGTTKYWINDSSNILTTPDIVTSGLVLNLDAANPQSYSGTGTTWYDLSGNNGNAILQNGVSYLASNGGAMSFDGIDDSANISYANQFDIKNAITLSIWVKRTSGFNQLTDVHLLSRPPSWYFYDSYNTGAVRGDLYIGGIRRAGLNVAVPFDNSWYQIVYTYDSANQTAIEYKNAVQTGTVTLSGLSSYLIDSSTANFNPMGYNSVGALGRTMILNTALIYNRALTPSEITQNFNALRGRYGI